MTAPWSLPEPECSALLVRGRLHDLTQIAGRQSQQLCELRHTVERLCAALGIKCEDL